MTDIFRPLTEDEFPPVEVYETPGAPWEALDKRLLNDGRQQAVPFPMALMGPWQDWIRTAAAGASAPVDFIATGMLTAAAASIGNSRRITAWSGWSEPCILWSVLVGLPSSGKSPAVTAVTDPIKDIEAALCGDYPVRKSEYERDKEAAKVSRSKWEDDVRSAVKAGRPAPDIPVLAQEPEPPVKPRCVINDPTTEAVARLQSRHPRGLLFVRDELAGWVQSFGRYNGAGDRAFWIECHGGRAYTVDRIKSAEPISIKHLSTSVTGGMQPDRLSSLFISGEDDDGLLARFLVSWPDKVPPRRPNVAVNEAPYREALQRLMTLPMETDVQGNLEPTVVPLAPDAADTLQAYREDNARTEDTLSGLALSHAGKAPGMALRLALVLEYLWWAAEPDRDLEPSEVGLRAMQAGCAMFDGYFLPTAIRAYGDAALPKNERGAAAIARRIARDGLSKVNARLIRRDWRLPGLTDVDDVKEALRVLEEGNWLKPDMAARKGSSPGRARSDYLVHPDIWSKAHE